MGRPALASWANNGTECLNPCGPEHRLVMCMLTAPVARHIWGDPAALAKTVSWDRFLAVADDRVKPFLHRISTEAPFSTLIPPAVEKVLAVSRVSTGVRNLCWAAELRQILEAFRREGVSLMVLKGSILQRTVYPDPSTRPMSDCDLLVRRDQMPQVERLMSGLAFHRRSALEAQTPGPGLEADEEGYFYKKVRGQFLLFEIHTRPEKDDPACSVSPTPLWDHCIHVETTDGASLPTLEPEAALRHLCLHLARAHGFERGLLWLLDVRLFVERHKGSIRWTQFMAESEAQTMPLIAFALCLAGEWLGADVPPEFEAAIPQDTRRVATPLAWAQMWDYADSRRPPGSLIIVFLSGDLRRGWIYLRNRVQRWFSPLPNGKAHRLRLMARRFWSDLRHYRAALREGGFRLSNLRSARRADQRFDRLRALFPVNPDHK